MRIVHWFPWMAAFGFVIGLSGCLPVPIEDFQGKTVFIGTYDPAYGGLGEYVNGLTQNIGDICDLPTPEEIAEEFLGRNGGIAPASYIKVDRVWLQYFVVTAGLPRRNWDDLTSRQELIMRIYGPNGTVAQASRGPAPTVIPNLVPEQPFDLLTADCLHLEFTLYGWNSDKPLQVTVSAAYRVEMHTRTIFEMLGF